MNRDSLIDSLKEEVKGLSSHLAEDDYTNACLDATRETGWAFPVSGEFQEFWQKERAKRHLFFYLATESAHKFKYKQINLQHRFDNYFRIIKLMDNRFEEIQSERPDMFANVDTYKLFGTKVDAGFQYEPQTGRDFTYSETNIVLHKPDEAD